MTQSSEVTNEIVTTVADYENASPNDLPSLADKLDAETYQQLLNPEDELSELLNFEYIFYEVTVTPDGEVIVTP